MMIKAFIKFGSLCWLFCLMIACTQTQPMDMNYRTSSLKFKKKFLQDEIIFRTPENGGGKVLVGQSYAIRGKSYTPYYDPNFQQMGLASWYGDFHAGKPTANGEVFDPDQLTAAHTTLPLPSVIMVTNLENNQSAILRVNDRGPFIDGRILDVSEKAAEILGFKNQGLANIKIKILPEATEKAIMALK